MLFCSVNQPKLRKFQQNSQNGFKQSNKQDFHMLIQNCLQPLNYLKLFRPVDQYPLHSLTHLPILQNHFSAHPDKPSLPHLLTLLGPYLLLSQAINPSPLAAVSLDFDLKFEVLHQIQGTLSSPKIGLRLYRDQINSCSFYSSQMVVERWACVLGGQIHQKGFHQRFRPLRKLGKGNFATVYEVERIVDSRKFAVKAFSKQSCFSASRGKESLANQLHVMRQLSKEGHHNLLRLEGVYQSDNSIYVVLELLQGGQLFHRIQERNGYFSPREIRQCVQGLVAGLAHMHSHRIMHRDLKPQNIMLRDTFSLEPVIVDYGLATNSDLPKYLFYRCGTPGYVAPEIIALKQNGHVDPECDVFSAGVIFHILLTRRPLFEGTKYEEVYRKNKQMEIKLDSDRYRNIDSQALDLLKKMLQADPAQRITAAQALSHPYFAGKGEDESSMCSPSLSCTSRIKGF